MTQKHCHKLIAKTAKAIAGAFYEHMMQDNDAYSAWKSVDINQGKTPAVLEATFISKMWPKFIEQARATLAKMLRGPLQSDLKDQIADALIKDASLQRGRTQGQGFRLN